MNKYQEALNKLISMISLEKHINSEHNKKFYEARDTLQELVDDTYKYIKMEHFLSHILQALVECYLFNKNYLDMSVDLKNTIKIIQDELGEYYL